MQRRLRLSLTEMRESDLQSSLIRPARGTPLRWVRARPIQGGGSFTSFNKPISDRARGRYQG